MSPLEEARDGRAAFDPRTGVPTVVWTNRPACSNLPDDEIQSFAQAAVRQAA